MPTFNNLKELYDYLEKDKDSPKKKALKETADKLAQVECQIAEHIVYGAGEPKYYKRGSGTQNNERSFAKNMTAKEITKGRNPDSYGSYKIGYDYYYEAHSTIWGNDKIPAGEYFCNYDKQYAVPMIIITGSASKGNSPIPEGFYSKPRDYVTKTFENINKYHMDTNYFIHFMDKYGVKVTKR